MAQGCNNLDCGNTFTVEECVVAARPADYAGLHWSGDGRRPPEHQPQAGRHPAFNDAFMKALVVASVADTGRA